MAVENLLFLGAGCSKAFGYPLTSEILPMIIDAVDKQTLTLMRDADVLVLRELFDVLLPGRGDKPLPLVTDVLSLVDHCIASGEALAPHIDLLAVRAALDASIARVVNERTKRAKPEVHPRSFAGWLVDRDLRAGGPTAVVSSNYDVSVDLELLRQRFDGDFDKDDRYRTVDFGFSWRTVDTGEIVPPPSKPNLILYKIHGSLNWLRCSRCGFIYVNWGISLVDWDDEECHCRHKPLSAVLVAPSFVRSVKDPNLLSIWQSTVERLRAANTWTFIGYSLPPEDLAIRSMLIRAWHGRSGTKPRIVVVDPKPEVVDTYRLLFGAVDRSSLGLKEYFEEETAK